ATWLRSLEGTAGADRLGLRSLAQCRRRDLGSPRRPAAVHVLEADVLGRYRSRLAAGRQAFVSGKPAAMAGSTRRDLRDGHESRLERRTSIVRADARRRST